MNIAAIISVAPNRAALTRATQTQNLLLEHLGSQLGSIRLAAPHLLNFACRGAIGERPDLLLIAGGSRAARRAGQIAYAHQLPILFLPGRRAPNWARELWGSLSLEDMVSALAQERLTPLRVPAGLASGEIFLGHATCGFLPELRQLKADLSETESLAASARILSSAAGAYRMAFGRKVRIVCHGETQTASAVMVEVQGEPSDSSIARLGAFACAAWTQGAATLAALRIRSAAGGDWRSAPAADRFTCTKLMLQSGSKTWLLLDGEAIPFEGPAELRYVPKAIQTFAFAPDGARLHAPPRNPFRAVTHKLGEPATGLPRSNPGRRKQMDGRDWMPARA